MSRSPVATWLPAPRKPSRTVPPFWCLLSKSSMICSTIRRRTGWTLSDHVTESIAFFLRIRTYEDVVAFRQLAETVQYVLKAIGYKEIIPYFTPAPPPISVSLLEIADEAGDGYELAFFDLLEKRIAALLESGVDNLQFSSLSACVKHLRGVKSWTRACDILREEIVCFIRKRQT